MSTRSCIITKTETGYAGIYCHFDGYPTGVGQTLLDHYQDPAKVADLVALGDISSLGERVVPIGPHSFSQKEDGTTVAYIRDRGETGCETHQAPTLEEVKKFYENAHDGYVYVFDGTAWKLNGEPLAEAIADSTREETPAMSAADEAAAIPGQPGARTLFRSVRLDHRRLVHRGPVLGVLVLEDFGEKVMRVALHEPAAGCLDFTNFVVEPDANLSLVEAARYGWVIDRDHGAAASGALDGHDMDRRGFTGPSNIDPEVERQLWATHPGPLPQHHFQMKDDDGELIYSGRFVGDPDSDDAFGPLDDFGRSDAGCTTIEYMRDGGWVAL